LSAFLQGTLDTFVWFTSEFEPSGVISQATSDQHALTCMETTNDANEGVLRTLCI
ncbi:hypothetical protein BS17DRAFT_711785, partial [Gyrodon lividus]